MKTKKREQGQPSDIKQNRIEIQSIKSDKGHFLMLKATIHNEDITLINTYA